MAFRQLQTVQQQQALSARNRHSSVLSVLCGETMGKVRGMVVSWENFRRIRKLIKMPEAQKELN